MDELDENPDIGSSHWLRDRCYACGHTLAYAATGCPQCLEHFDGRDDPEQWPATCECKRCKP
jgi:hypothetical protein